MSRLFYIFVLTFVCGLFVTYSAAQADSWKNLFDSTQASVKLEKFSDAKMWGEKALIAAENEFGKPSDNYIKTVKELVDIYYYTEEYDNAFDFARLDSALRAESGKNHETSFAMSLTNLGLLYLDIKGNYAESDKRFREAIKLHKELGIVNDSLFSLTLSSAALLYEITGRYNDSEALYIEALGIWKAKGGEKTPDYAYTLNNLAAVYKMTARYEEAEPIYKQVLSIDSVTIGVDHPRHALNLHNLAGLYVFMGKYEKAEPIYKESLKIKKIKLGEKHKSYANTLNNLAELYRKMGRYKKAEPLYIKALEIKKKVYSENHVSYATSANNYALLNIMIKNYDEAEKLYQQSTAIYKKKFGENHPAYANSLGNLGKMYTITGKYDDADKMFSKALDILGNLKQMGKKHPDYAKNLYFLGNLYTNMKKFDKSEDLYKEAIEIRYDKLGEDHPDYIKNVFDIATMYQIMNKNSSAEPYFNKALNKTMGQVKRQFPYLSENEKQKFWSTLKADFETFNSFAVAYGQENPSILAMMFDYTLATKGLILSSTKKVFRRIRQSDDEDLKAVFNKWQRTKEYWLRLIKDPAMAKKLKIDPDSLSDVANDYEKELATMSSEFRKAFDTTATTWRDIQRVLKDGEAAVELIRLRKYGLVPNENNSQVLQTGFTDSVYYAALIISKECKNNPELVILKNGNELEKKYIKLFGSLIKVMKLPPRRSFSELTDSLVRNDLKNLYNQYWAKIAAKTKQFNRVYLSLDGVYNNLSLLSLINPDTDQHLIEEQDIRILTNTADLIQYAKHKEKPKLFTAELFGNPRYDIRNIDGKSLTVKIPPLPGTKIEVEEISSDMNAGKWEVKSHLDDEASEGLVKAVESPRVLHIATHGYFMKDVQSKKQSSFGMDNSALEDNPLLRSMLFFAGAENTVKKQDPEQKDGEDGILYAEEAMNLNLDNTEMVVLSACETGLGDVQNGEGVYGLQRSFQVAGARSLIMSLWTVSDSATKKLMMSFYDKLLSGSNKRDAFREAQIELKAEYPDFYYWGAFIMVGE